MNFSLDTNIILGIVNTRDRLHEVSIALMRDKRKEPLILCNSAIKESHNVLRNKINEIMVEIIGFFRDIYQDPNIGSIDSQALIIEKFKKIKTIKPGLANFLDLVFHEISLFLKEHDIEGLPSFLSQLSINLSGSIIKKIDEIHPIEFFLNDREFAKNCKKGFANISNDLGFKKEAFSCRLLK